ncbi:MAG: amino acid adenylation domain-containing protein [Myxococcota bacterium]
MDTTAPHGTYVERPLAVSEGGPITAPDQAFDDLPAVLAHAAVEGVGKRLVFLSSAGEPQVWTYEDLLDRAERICGGLRQRGLLPGARILVLLEHAEAVLPVFWGCVLGGFVPLVMEVPESMEPGNRAFDHVCRVAQMLGEPLLVTEPERRSEVESALAGGAAVDMPVVELPVVDLGELAAGPRDGRHHRAERDELAFLCFSSGSTGIPKCIMLTHRCVILRNAGVNQHNDHHSDDVNLNWLPFDHIGSITEHIRSMQLCCDLVYVGKDYILEEPLRLLDVIDRYRVTHTWGPNFIYALIQNALGDSPGAPQGDAPGASGASRSWDLSCVRFLISGGEAASREAMGEFLARTRAFGFPATGFRPSFGMVEVSAGITYFAPSPQTPLGFVWLARAGINGEPVERVEPDHPGAKPYGRLGRPIPGCTMRVIDEHGTVLPEGVVGRVQVRGAALAAGYLDNPELTDAIFLSDGWLETEDLGFLLDGELVLTGRTKEMLVINGVNYYSRELEDIVESLDGVEVSFTAACAVTRPGCETEQLAIFYCPTDLDPAHTAPLNRRIRDALVRRARANPRAIIALDRAAIPKTAIGKIQRLELARRFERGEYEAQRCAESTSAAVVPRNPHEQLLAEIWQRVLGRPVGVHDNFFEVGGDSIKAVMVVAQVQARVPAAAQAGAVQSVSLFDAPTIAELAEHLGATELAAVEPATDELSLARFAVVPEPDQRDLPFPLTDIQQAYWAGRSDFFELGGRSVHAYTEVEGVEIDLHRLGRAWQRMIERHEMLRTVIRADGMQQILETVPPYAIEVEDLRARSAAERAARLDAVRQRMSHQVLPCETWPTFELRAVLLDRGRCRLYMSFDALFLDARSYHILLTEFGRLYAEPDAALEPLILSYRDYVRQERAIKRSPLFDRARDYWKSRLDELPGPPQLPLATTARELKTPRFFQLHEVLSPSVWRNLQVQAARAHITPSCLLLAVFADALRPWSRNERFTLNITAYRRLPLHPQVNNIIGDFSSLTLLAVDAPGDDDFIARARKIQRRLMADLDHATFSGLDVLRELGRRRGEPTAALAPVVFTSVLGDQMHAPGEQPLAWLGEVVFNVTQTPQIWFDHIAFEEGGSLVCRWNVVEGLLSPGVPEAIFGAYIGHLRRLAADEHSWRVPWSQTRPALVPAAQLEARARVNDTTTDATPRLLHEGFFEQAQRRPDAVAVVAADRTLDYRTLALLARRVGHRLRRAGVEARTPVAVVAVMMEKGWEQVVAVLGVLAAGAAYLPIDPGLPEARSADILTRSGVRLVLTQSHVRPLLSVPDSVEVICVDDPELEGGPSAPLPSRQQSTDLAYVIFTSGSSGRPKGVMIDHRGAWNTIVDINRRFGIDAEDRVLALSALSFDLSVYDIFGPLAAGGAVVMPRPGDTREPSRWARLVKDHRVTIWNSVPAFMSVLVDYADGDRGALLGSLRLVMLSGDWIPLALPDQVRALPGRPAVVSLGGATEASIWSILYPIEHPSEHPSDTAEPAWRSIPYGRPMDNQTFHVLDDALEPCPDWVPGMLYIGGIGVAQGYLGDPERTARSFVLHPRTGERLYRTGDRGRFVPGRRPEDRLLIEFLGREDLQVKIQGFRVELGEIEVALGRHPDVESAVVVARGERHADKQLVAYVVARRESPDLAEQLRRHLASLLPAYMVPARTVVLDRLPLSANGKVDRSKLPALATDPATDPAMGAEHRRSLPRSPKVARGVAQITEIVATVLGSQRPGHDEDLFALGATSIDVMRIVNHIEKQTGVRLAYDQVFAEPTVAGIAAAVERPSTSPGMASSGGEADAVGRGLALPVPLLDEYPPLVDPDDRKRFTKAEHGLRSLDGPEVTLDPTVSEAVARMRGERRTCRHFGTAPISVSALGELLACLRRFEDGGKPQYLYGSAGGLYPVQTYLYVKPDRIEGLAGGYYHHDPVVHRLVRLGTASDLDETIYDPLINRPVWQGAAFGLYLVAKLAAIVPMYRESSLSFCAIEAGLVAQLLELHAPYAGLGLAQMGQVDFGRLQGHFALDDGHVLVHSLMGGAPAEHTPIEPARPTRIEEEF